MDAAASHQAWLLACHIACCFVIIDTREHAPASFRVAAPFSAKSKITSRRSVILESIK